MFSKPIIRRYHDMEIYLGAVKFVINSNCLVSKGDCDGTDQYTKNNNPRQRPNNGYKPSNG